MDSNRRGTQKFTCYFCNKTIENETQMAHTSVCSSVLVPCPNKCGSYVPRRDLAKHKKECLNRVSRSLGNSPQLNQNVSYNPPLTPTTTYSLDRHQNVMYPKTEPKIQHDELVRLSNKLSILEQKLNTNQFHNSPHIDPRQNFETLKNNHMQLSMEVQKLKYDCRATMELKQKLDAQTDSIKSTFSSLQNSKRESELHLMGLQERIMQVEKQQADLGLLRNAFYEDQAWNRQAYSDFSQDLTSIKNHFSNEHATFATVLNDQKNTIELLKKDVEDIKRCYEDQKGKFINIVFDIRAASQIASESAEKIEIQEREFNQIRKEINQIKLDLEILEGLSSNNDPNISPGRLLWKVTEVSLKRQKAIDFGSVLKSPVFYSHEYGYKIKVLFYLNGLKKWKDRYALLCIHVLKGDYDMLLQWPCHIEGTITLRNLQDNKAKPFSKYITAKKEYGDEEDEEPQESSSSYIFIPHATLFKEQYIKEDTLFLDIKIQKSSKMETSL